MAGNRVRTSKLVLREALSGAFKKLAYAVGELPI